MQNRMDCTFCNSKLIASDARVCGNRLECQTLYCNDQCAQRDWNQHYAKCSSLKLIQTLSKPSISHEEILKKELAELQAEYEREQRADQQEIERLRRELIVHEAERAERDQEGRIIQQERDEAMRQLRELRNARQ